MAYTVAEVARLLGKSPSTIRNWSREFETFLSTSAAPPAGDDRIYQDDDVAVLATVAVMRAERRPFETIRAALHAGERVRPAMDQPDEEPDEEPPRALVSRLTATVAAMSGQVDELRRQLEAERAGRIDAERRAAIAETRLSLLTAPPEMPLQSPTMPPAPESDAAMPSPAENALQSAPDAPQTPDRPSWRERFGRWVAGR